MKIRRRPWSVPAARVASRPHNSLQALALHQAARADDALCRLPARLNHIQRLRAVLMLGGLYDHLHA